MCRVTQEHGKLRSSGRYLLAVSLWMGMSAIASAEGFPDDLDAHALNPITQRIASDVPVITCGSYPGQRTTSLNIRGADVATLWRSAYRMIFPGLSLANSSTVDHAAKLTHKRPAWGISISHDSALMTIQTKW